MRFIFVLVKMEEAVYLITATDIFNKVKVKVADFGIIIIILLFWF